MPPREHYVVPDPTESHARFKQTRHNALMTTIVLFLCTLFGQMDPDLGSPPPAGSPLFQWSDLPALPAPAPGGSFGGIVENKITLAGGSHFPEPAWQNEKIWSDRIISLDLSSDTPAWSEESLTLPEPIGYGASVSLPDGSLLLVGGSDGTQHKVNCWFLTATSAGLHLHEAPSLPTPLACMSAVLVGSHVYLVGGIETPDSIRTSARVMSLDWSDPKAEWNEVVPIPDQSGGRMLCSVASHGGNLYVFGGCRLVPSSSGSASRIYLDDVWKYVPGEESSGFWSSLREMPRPAAASPVPAPTIGASFIVIAGGDDGSNVENIARLQERHPGFTTDFLAYHVITDEWTVRPGFPGSPVLTNPMVQWNDLFIFPGGEIRPRNRSGEVYVGISNLEAPRFTTLDWFALGIYLSLLVLLGLYFTRREQTTDDFFLGGRRVPWWAAGISIFATQLSAITFMAIPAKSYSSDWTLFIQSLGIFAMAPVVAYLFLPFFRGLNITTAYEYLERRFSLGIRMFGSAQYLLFQFGRMAIVVYLPAIALSSVTGLEVHACILLMGVLCIIYTVLGGIEAVIWSDVIQAFVLVGGALLILVWCINGVDGGISELYDRASSSGRLRIADVDWDFTRSSLPVVILGGIFINLIPYASDQSVVQRYLTTSDERSARKAIWLGGLIAIPASILFFGLGTALFGFYDANPDLLGPISKTDQIVPWFLVNEVPSGLAGLVIAGVFAAAMSSLDSSMNSSATALINDFYRRLRPASVETNEASELLLARILTVVLGCIGTAAALVLASFPAESVFDQWLEIVGLFASGLCGLFVLGVFTQRPGTVSAVIGIISSVVLLILVKNFTDLNGLLYAGIGTMTCFTTGWVSGLFLSDGRQQPGTSLWNRRKTLHAAD